MSSPDTGRRLQLALLDAEQKGAAVAVAFLRRDVMELLAELHRKRQPLPADTGAPEPEPSPTQVHG